MVLPGSSSSALACEMSPNFSLAVQNPSAPKDHGFKENQLIHSRAHYSLKSFSSSGDTSLINSVRSQEVGNVDYDSGHNYASASSFEFHKGERAHRLALVSFSKPAPSKWDDAHKWIANPASADNLARNKTKIGQPQSHGVQATAPRKTSLPGQGHRQFGSGNGHATKVVLEVADQMASIPEKVDTKRIDPDQSKREVGTQKFITLQSGLDPHSKSVNWAPDPYPAVDDFGSQFLDQQQSFHGDSCVKSSLLVGNPVANSAFRLRRHDVSISIHSATAFIPPPSTVRSVSMRDMGTEMTPIASQEPSRTATPVRATTPMCSPTSSRPSTPGRIALTFSPAEASDYQVDINKSELSQKELQMRTRREIMVLGTQLGRTSITAWASKEEEEKDASTLLKTVDVEQPAKSVIEIRAVAWEEAEKAKYMARYKREEIKIQAWENHQKAKTEAEMRRIEVEVERMRGRAHECLMNKFAAARHKAEEKCAAAEARRNQQAANSAEQTEYIRRTGRISSSFSCCSWCS